MPKKITGKQRRRRVLVIGDSVRRRIAGLASLAKRDRIDQPSMLKIMSGESPPPGDDPSRVVMVPRGYRCVFTVEESKSRTGWFRHL